VLSTEANKTYQVVVTVNECSDTSDCVESKSTNGIKTKLPGSWSFYPNPTNKFIVLELPAHVETDVSLELLTTDLKVVSRITAIGNRTVMDIAVPKGIYVIRVTAGKDVYFERLIVQ
jgi:hypothetical protein